MLESHRNKVDSGSTYSQNESSRERAFLRLGDILAEIAGSVNRETLETCIDNKPSSLGLNRSPAVGWSISLGLTHDVKAGDEADPFRLSQDLSEDGTAEINHGHL